VLVKGSSVHEQKDIFISLLRVSEVSHMQRRLVSFNECVCVCLCVYSEIVSLIIEKLPACYGI
jgi:hypothetical protein